MDGREGAAKDKNLKGVKRGTVENVMDDREGAAKESEKHIVSVAEAAAKIDPYHLREHLVNAVRECWHPEKLLSRYTDYFEEAFDQVSFPWVKMFKDSPLSTLIRVPLSHIPRSVAGTTRNWINLPPVKPEVFSAFVLRAFDHILLDLEGGGDDSKSQVGMFVALAIVLRSKPEALTPLLPILRDSPKYQGHDKLPVTVWMMAQASRADPCLGLFSWAHNLLPLVTVSNKKRCCIPQSLDLILQFAEEILSRPKARTILVDGSLTEGEPLIPLSSFEILVRLAFPAPSARVKSTRRVEAIYPLLKDVALSPGTTGGSNAVKQMFTFSLRSARKGFVTGNLALAKEATSIAIWCVIESVDCFEHWGILYRENLEASVALLKKLVDDHHFLRLSTSPSDTLTVIQTMESFRRKNKRAIAEGGANCSLYKEADKYCTLISKSLSPGSGGFRLTPITTVVLAAAGAAAGAAAALVVLP